MRLCVAPCLQAQHRLLHARGDQALRRAEQHTSATGGARHRRGAGRSSTAVAGVSIVAGVPLAAPHKDRRPAKREVCCHAGSSLVCDAPPGRLNA